MAKVMSDFGSKHCMLLILMALLPGVNFLTSTEPAELSHDVQDVRNQAKMYQEEPKTVETIASVESE